MLLPLKKYYRQLIVTFLLLFSFLIVAANTAEQDIEVILSIEVGDAEEDFDDGLDPFPRGQFVTYRIEVKNTGDQGYADGIVLMDTPDFMTYVPNSTFYAPFADAVGTLLPDGGVDMPISPLEIGYDMQYLQQGSSQFYFVTFQVDTEINDDPEYALAWANVNTKYNAVPIISNLIESKITGDPQASIRVSVHAYPPEGDRVYPNTTITYNYVLTNLGGETATNVILTVSKPANTDCVTNCDVAIDLGDLLPGVENSVSEKMEVKVSSNISGASSIINTGYNLDADDITTIENRDQITHPLTVTSPVVDGDFWINIQQNPRIVLNSKDGLNARYDSNDRTDTEYQINFKGDQQYVYPAMSQGYGGSIHGGGRYCIRLQYSYPFGTYFYAYNSARTEYCRRNGPDDCYPTVESAPIQFQMTTDLPQGAPELINTTTGTTYQIQTTHTLDSYLVHPFMRIDNNDHTIPVNGINGSRAIENGSLGIVNGKVETVGLVRDRWEFAPDVRYDIRTRHCYFPGYSWQKVESTPITLTDTAQADVSVLTSTAWLKTDGGHVGTNQSISSTQTRPQYEYNMVNLSYQRLDGTYISKEVQTPSNVYTPDQSYSSAFGDGLNSDYMVFASDGNPANFKSAQGSAWVQMGTDFQSKNDPLFLQKGDPYDRDDLPRDYNADIFDREIYGEIRTDKQPKQIISNIDLGDDIIWKQTGDLTFGRVGFDDTLILKGGQSRIYTEGDVYINANLVYEDVTVQEYNKITSVRIDARNIYISPEVTDLEIMMLARGEFHSGKGNQQLRILGDVIANKSFWERTPLLEENPTEFNRASEYIIEDYRKYIAPPPGDTQLPEERNVWRQVNPSTGESLDAY